MKQFDYIKIRLNKVKEFNKEYLVEHPTIKNRFKINHINLFGKNIDIYLNKKGLNVLMSMPYLKYNHNYVHFGSREMEEIFLLLSELLKVDLFEAELIELEYAQIVEDIAYNSYRNKLIGVTDMELLKKNKSFIMYGNSKRIIKIYDILKNLKSKLSSSLFDSVNFNKGDLKIELKYPNVKKAFGTEILVKELITTDFISRIEIDFQKTTSQIRSLDNTNDFSPRTFSEILYHSLKQISRENLIDTDSIIYNTITSSSLSNSQKSIRRKSLREIAEKYQ